MTTDPTESTLTLTRRRLLGGALSVGVGSAAAGAGTLSLFSDSQRAEARVSVGTLDLTVDGDDERLQFLDREDLAPGDTGESSLTLRNAGSLPGYLDIETVSVTDDENGQAEPDSQNDPAVGDGELANVLEVRVSLVDDEGTETYLCDDAYGTLDTRFDAGTTFDLDKRLAAGDELAFVFEWRVPADAGNEVTSDIAAVDLRFSLEQTADDDNEASCETDGDGGSDDDDETDDYESGSGTARSAMGGWDWATLARYGQPDDSKVNGSSEPENYELAVLKHTGSGTSRVHAQNAHFQREWESGRTESVSVDYDGSKVSMTVGDTTYPDKNGTNAQGVGSERITAVGVTVEANHDDATAGVTSLELDVDGETTTIDDDVITAGSDDGAADYVFIEQDIDGAFSLDGTLEFTWEETATLAPSDLSVRVDVLTTSGDEDDD